MGINFNPREQISYKGKEKKDTRERSGLFQIKYRLKSLGILIKYQTDKEQIL